MTIPIRFADSARKRWKNLRFGFRVHRGGRLVEHENVCVAAHEGAAQRDLLPLPDRELLAVLEPACSPMCADFDGALAKGEFPDTDGCVPKRAPY